MLTFEAAIQKALTPHADPQRAVAMAAYMRGKFTFLGIATPLRRAATRELIKSYPADGVITVAQRLWELPEREYTYVALGLLARHHKTLTPSDLPALLELARRRSWWDSVDGLAGVVGDVVRRHRPAQTQMDLALRDPDIWVQRIAMLHQLGWREHTDTVRLFGYASSLAGGTDFFTRKAIGWALREYAWHDPAAVKAYLNQMGETLSGLTRREAGKHLT